MAKGFDMNLKRTEFCLTFYSLEETMAIWYLYPSDIIYYCYQLEQCPSTGRWHHQGYVEWKYPISLRQLKDIIPTAHLEPRLGTRYEAMDYCRVPEIVECDEETGFSDGGGIEGTFCEIGIWRETIQGIRHDFTDIVQMCSEAEGHPTIIRDIYKKYPGQYAHCSNGIDKIRAQEEAYAMRERPFKEKKVIYLHGNPGCGKTRSAFELAQKANEYIYKVDIQGWFERYLGETFILFDDVNKDTMTIKAWLNFLDGFTQKLNVKGTSTYNYAETVIITSNYSPDELMDNMGVDPIQITAFKRRLTEITDFNKL